MVAALNNFNPATLIGRRISTHKLVRQLRAHENIHMAFEFGIHSRMPYLLGIVVGGSSHIGGFQARGASSIYGVHSLSERMDSFLSFTVADLCGCFIASP